MYYTVTENEQRRKLRVFVEIDRSTMSSERLAVKLIKYARLFRHEAQPVGRGKPAATGPAWLHWYPVFPRVLFVLTGASRTRLENRMSDQQALVAHHPLVAAIAHGVRLLALDLLLTWIRIPPQGTNASAMRRGRKEVCGAPPPVGSAL